MLKQIIFIGILTGIVQSICAQTVTIKFIHFANGKKIAIDSNYTNFAGEAYKISRLKYYVTSPALSPTVKGKTKYTSYLIDAFGKDSISLKPVERNFSKLSFTLGVDSAHNCSGAQEGDLDPLNGMFWTWQTGYINFKLEGFSPAAQNENNKLEYHIGGYKLQNKTMRSINLQFEKPLQILPGKKATIYVLVKIDKLWKGKNEFTIGQSSVITQPGKPAVSVAENFDGLFSIEKVEVSTIAKK